MKKNKSKLMAKALVGKCPYCKREVRVGRVTNQFCLHGPGKDSMFCEGSYEKAEETEEKMVRI